LAALLASSTITQAISLQVQNNSFENITASVSAPTSLGVTLAGTNTTSFGAWTATAGASLAGLSPSSISAGTGISLGGPTPTDGSFDARISLSSGVGASVSLSQILNSTFLPNSSYTLSFDLDAGANVALLGQAVLELRAGSSTVASLSSSSLLSLLDTSSGFQTINLNYVTGDTAPSGNIGLFFGANSLAGVSGNIYFDNVGLTVQTVPEPSFGALMGAGLGLLCIVTRFKKLCTASSPSCAPRD
jgi:hypothetical protein